MLVVTSLVGGHQLSWHTTMGLVSSGDAGKGHMMSGRCWLQSPPSPLTIYNTFAFLKLQDSEEEKILGRGRGPHTPGRKQGKARQEISLMAGGLCWHHDLAPPHLYSLRHIATSSQVL